MENSLQKIEQEHRTFKQNSENKWKNTERKYENEMRELRDKIQVMLHWRNFHFALIYMAMLLDS